MKKNYFIACLTGIVFIGCAQQVSAQQIIKQQKIADGIERQVVDEGNGRIFIRTVGENVPERTTTAAPLKEDASPKDTVFSESFEGYPGASAGLNWIPSDWTKKIAPGNEPTEEMIEHNINNSWYCYFTGDGMFTPHSTDGEKDAFIHFGYKDETYGLEPVAQDEWLISPQITLPQGKLTLDFLLGASYFDCYNNDYFDWNTITFSQRDVVNNFLVMVSTDEVQWDSIFDFARDVMATKTDREIYNTEFTTYLPYQVDLSTYAGKTIKLGFRYTRDEGEWKGNSMALDGIYVTAESAAGINSISSTQTGETAYYNLSGVRVAKPSAGGIYIKRENGKTTKFVCK